MDMRDPTNVKGHAEGVISESIGRFGYVEPVVADERTGKLVSGHGRIESLHSDRLAGDVIDGAPAVPPDGVQVADNGDWLVPVVRGWASRDDDEARAFMVTANRAPELGGWTDDLAGLLVDLGTTAGGLPPGFTPDDIDSLLADLGRGQLPDQGSDADHADDLSNRGSPATPRQQQGLAEVGLMFQADHHTEFLALLAQLRQEWGDIPTPMVVLRALRIALGADEA